MPTVAIINRFTGTALFTATVDAASTNPTRDAVVAAIAAGVSLAGARLSNAVLDGVDFSRQFLRGIDFRGSSLVGCLFVATDLSLANLQRADMTSADLSGAVMVEVDPRGTIGMTNDVGQLQQLVRLSALQLERLGVSEEDSPNVEDVPSYISK
jgi:uncharacterized protein YjbI with pentapeptide repeats